MKIRPLLFYLRSFTHNPPPVCVLRFLLSESGENARPPRRSGVVNVGRMDCGSGGDSRDVSGGRGEVAAGDGCQPGEINYVMSTGGCNGIRMIGPEERSILT